MTTTELIVLLVDGCALFALGWLQGRRDERTRIARGR